MALNTLWEKEGEQKVEEGEREGRGRGEGGGGRGGGEIVITMFLLSYERRQIKSLTELN